MTTRPVTGTYSDPAGTPLTGRVVFQLVTLASDGETIYGTNAVAALLDQNGHIAVDLVPTDTLDVNGICYRVTEHLNGQPITRYYIELPAAPDALDLADADRGTDAPRLYWPPGGAGAYATETELATAVDDHATLTDVHGLTALAAEINLRALLDDPLGLGLAATVPPWAIAGQSSLLANRAYYTRLVGARSGVTKARMRVLVQSGNICIAVYANNNGTPGTRLLTTGSIACPSASGDALVDLGGTLDITHGDFWLGFVVDNGTASFVLNSYLNQFNPIGSWGKYQDSTFPLPSTPTPKTEALSARGPAIELIP